MDEKEGGQEERRKEQERRFSEAPPTLHRCTLLIKDHSYPGFCLPPLPSLRSGQVHCRIWAGSVSSFGSCSEQDSPVRLAGPCAPKASVCIKRQEQKVANSGWAWQKEDGIIGSLLGHLALSDSGVGLMRHRGLCNRLRTAPGNPECP